MALSKQKTLKGTVLKMAVNFECPSNNEAILEKINFFTEWYCTSKRLKIEKAKNLLQYSDTDIVGIANYLAFSSQSHFISVFKKYEGITPHKFRERYFRTSWGLG